MFFLNKKDIMFNMTRAWDKGKKSESPTRIKQNVPQARKDSFFIF